MKITFAVAMLFASTNAYLGEKVWSLKSINDHRTDSQIQKAYGDHSTKQANARPPYQSAAQLDKNEPVWGLQSVNDHRDDSNV